MPDQYCWNSAECRVERSWPWERTFVSFLAFLHRPGCDDKTTWAVSCDPPFPHKTRWSPLRFARDTREDWNSAVSLERANSHLEWLLRRYWHLKIYFRKSKKISHCFFIFENFPKNWFLKQTMIFELLVEVLLLRGRALDVLVDSFDFGRELVDTHWLQFLNHWQLGVRICTVTEYQSPHQATLIVFWILIGN